MISKDQKILIVGLGLLGGSYAKGLSEAGYHVMGIARRQETIDYALKNKLIQEGSIEIETLANKADVVVFGLYPEAMIEWIEHNQSHFKAGVLISDVSGVKCHVVDKVQNILREDLQFISAHPMAGKESSGIEYANTEMFKSANYIITPTAKNTQVGIDFAYDLAKILNFHHISVLSCEEHDHMIAFLSQLTHVIAVSLMNTHDNSHLVEYTGDSFRDLTRIAKINETMWSELFLLNKDVLLDEIDSFITSISNFRDVLAKQDKEKMKQLFVQSTERRKKFDK